ncbi:hypothetical protein [Mycoplasmopsis felis]|uniref:hypothetical protein n=1 Tax=Mycoplasmopsis felis TaxID=33923 RepID=UPI002FEF9356
MQILQFHKISETEITQSLRNIINSHFNYLNISNDNLLNLARFSNGDLRASINNLQLLALLKKDNKEITQEDLKVIIPNISFYSDTWTRVLIMIIYLLFTNHYEVAMLMLHYTILFNFKNRRYWWFISKNVMCSIWRYRNNLIRMLL